MTPNVVLVMLVLENPFGLTRLKVLKDSPRSCSFQRPSALRLKYLLNVISTLEKPGPRTVPRPALPGRITPSGTGAKQAVLNHFGLLAEGAPAHDFGAPCWGSQVISGRALAALLLPTLPRPA